MEKKHCASKHSTGRITLTKKIGLLLLMPLFGSLVSIAFFVGFMEETRTEGHFVNVAGRQRMLSAELRAWAHMVAMGQVEDRAGLETRIAEFEKSLSTMERGGEVMNGLLVPAPPEVGGELAAVDKFWRTLKPDLIDVAVRPRGEPQFQEAYRRVESGTDELQELSHQLVTRFEERTQHLRRRMLYTLGSIACLMGIIFLVGIFLARRYIVQPILRFDEAARRIGSGDFSQRLEITTQDELSFLAHTFNQMAAETEQLLNALNLRRRYAETIIASVPAGLLVLRDDLAVLSANCSFRETFGVDKQAIARHPMVTEVLPVNGLKEAVIEVLSTGEAKRNLPMEMPAKDGLGSRRLLRITLAGTRLAEEEEEEEARLLVIVEDVTEEEALRATALESERRFRDLVQGLDAIVWEGEASGEGLRFTFVSRRAETILGLPAERWLADPDFWKDRVHPDDRDAASGFCRRLIEHGGGSHGEGAAWEVEFRMQAADGRMVWFRNVARQAADSPGVRPRGVMMDITSRKQAEQALIESEQRYAALFEAAPVPTWVFDSATHQFLAVNQAAIKSYGYSAEEFRSMTVFDIRPESEHGHLRQKLTEQVRWRKGNWQHRRKDGSVFPVEAFSKSVQHAGRAARFVVALDISAQVNAEKEVAEHLFMLQRAADAAQAITWHQTLQGTLQEVAEQARGVIGTHQAAVILTHGNDWAQAINALSLSEKYAEHLEQFEPVDGSGIRALVCQTNRALRMTQAELEAHPRWRGFGTQQLPTRGWLAVPLTARDGKNIGLLQLSDKYEGEFTQQDEYVAMELAQLASSAIENARLIEEVSQLNTGLEKKVAERTTALRVANQELEAFSYSVSHDLRSPLNTIDGFSQLLAKQLAESDNEKAQHYLSRIRAGTAQMGQLIGDLLSLAHVARTQMNHEPVDLSALSRGILDDLQARQPERQMALHIEPGLQAQGDAGLLRVVLENLLGNACKFSSQQAQAEISIGQKLDAAGEPVFFVQDNGAGFDMAYANKLFQPFQRLHAVAEFPGTGIGLATVSRVIARHGGRTWADAAPARGATFFFTLPKVPGVV